MEIEKFLKEDRVADGIIFFRVIY